MERYDNKGRKLRTGESQLKSGKMKNCYKYQWKGCDGIRHNVYSWRLTASDKLPEGRRPCEPLRDIIARIQRDEHAGVSHSMGNHTLDYYHRVVIDSKNIRASTVKAYNTSWNKVSIADRKVNSLKHSDILKFLKSLHKDGYATRYIKMISVQIEEALNLAFEDGAVSRNVAKGCYAKLGLELPEQQRSLTKEETKKFFDHIATMDNYIYYEPMFTVLAWSGMRIGELLALTWNDIDFKDNVIHVNKTMTYLSVNGKMEKHITEPKTKASIRDIPMLSVVKSALLKRKEASLFNHCEEVIDGYSDFVFTGKLNKTMIQSTAFYILEKIIKDYNKKHDDKLPNFSLHTFRHTFATRLCEISPNVKFVQTTLGHSDVSTTLGIYAECQTDTMQEEMKKIDNVMKMA